MGLRGAGGGGADGGEPHGILEGISSLHSWIKTQTMIRPHPGMGRRGKLGGYDEVSGDWGFCREEGKREIMLGIDGHLSCNEHIKFLL